jgi:Fe-S oxidoreductase
VGKHLGEKFLGIDRRRALPKFAPRTLTQTARPADHHSEAVLFNDTFTNYYDPEIGMAALDVLRASGVRAGIASHVCCGRPQISKGLLKDARTLAERNTSALHPHAVAGRKIIFCEPSCLSAVREDAPSLLRGDLQKKASDVAAACVLFEEFLSNRDLPLKAGPSEILLHGHCHQKSMGLLAPAKTLLGKIPGATVVDLDAGCCGMAGSFGYSHEHFEVSRAIGERKLLPAVRQKKAGTVVVASGTSCRHQVKDFTGEVALHPAMLLRSLLVEGPE